MKQSRLLGKTLREVPKDAQTAAHALMLRAGYIQQLSAGVYIYLPLLYRTLAKLSQIVREEMEAAGGVELLMPALQPQGLVGGIRPLGAIHRRGWHHVRLQGSPGRHRLPGPHP